MIFNVSKVVSSRRWRIGALLVLVVVCLLVAMAAFSLDPRFLYALRVQATDWLAPEPSVSLEFRRTPAERPSLGSGAFDTPMMVMDPCVITDQEGQHLFFSTVYCETENGLSPFWRPENGEQFDIRKLVTGISYAFSENRGESWTVRKKPLLLPAKKGWDDYRVETATAIVHDHTLHLFYCADGKELPARYQIGEVSLKLTNQSLRQTLQDESVTLARRRDSPLLAANYRKSSFHNNLQEPSVLFRKGRFELYFVGLQLTRPADSMEAPGQDMSRIGMGRAILDDNLKVLEISAAPVVDLANIIEVKPSGNELIAFTTLAATGPAHQGERIGYRTSKDGINWSRAREVLAPRAGQFDNWGCMSGTVVKDKDGWVLYYTALEHQSSRPASRWAIALGPSSWLFSTLGRAECPNSEPRR